MTLPAWIGIPGAVLLIAFIVYGLLGFTRSAATGKPHRRV